MEVSIELFGRQRIVTQRDAIEMPITEETRVSDVIEYIRQQYPALQLNEEKVLITVNHETAPLDRILGANDTVSFIPFISGG